MAEASGSTHHISSVLHHFLADPDPVAKPNVSEQIRPATRAPALTFLVASAADPVLSGVAVKRLAAAAEPAGLDTKPQLVWEDLGVIEESRLLAWEATVATRSGGRGPPGQHCPRCDGLVWCLVAERSGSLAAALTLGRLAAASQAPQIKIILFDNERTDGDRSAGVAGACLELVLAVAPQCRIEAVFCRQDPATGSRAQPELPPGPRQTELFMRLAGSLKMGAVAARQKEASG